MNPERTDDAAAARHARYGSLPERIRLEDTSQDVDAGRNGGGRDLYDPEGAWKYSSCLAVDLGL